MKKVEHLGVIKTKHNSGIAETDKGNKFPFNKCEIGDVMLQVEDTRMIVSKEVYNKEYKADVTKYKKEQAEALEKAQAQKEEQEKNMVKENANLKLELAKKSAELDEANAQIEALKEALDEANAALAEKLVDEVEKADDEDGRNA